ncbi:uncharacterized protein Z520_05354 [Fonsecaea multimorphosa CBS 102226]|uniref:Uncharacterized protein n=1 Tax=Fonsecaea multimorphosa CBS 102226 TaxID=1442371 RepID=A0A0D2KQC9_9EURO|nr:uncharacterized protein Z520_05354 [Fonsecaea multimorphosa CBS 102226]KIX98893.1 hypothetical protein Z520_05354 [Fonsecaea multimorphosa CBS 102226]OAL25170.1 hypothetical protein AYO22_05047 [Fonsecaea multimorphosa]
MRNPISSRSRTKPGNDLYQNHHAIVRWTTTRARGGRDRDPHASTSSEIPSSLATISSPVVVVVVADHRKSKPIASAAADADSEAVETPAQFLRRPTPPSEVI